MTFAEAKKLLLLLDEGSIVQSKLSKKMAQSLLDNGVVVLKKRQSGYRYLLNSEAHLGNFLGVENAREHLASFIDLHQVNADRATFVNDGHSSKKSQIHPLNGLFFASVEGVKARVNQREIEIKSVLGSAFYLQELYEDFIISPEVLVVVVENSENIINAERYRYLFDQNRTVLFVYRARIGSLLENLDNDIIYFGDIDIAAVSIYENEIVPHIKHQRHTFFIPDCLEEKLADRRYYKSQNRLFCQQEKKFRNYKSMRSYLQELIDILRKNRQSIEQEGLLKKI